MLILIPSKGNDDLLLNTEHIVSLQISKQPCSPGAQKEIYAVYITTTADTSTLFYDTNAEVLHLLNLLGVNI